MSTLWSIRVTFNNAQAQADQLAGCAEQLRSEQRRMDSIIDGLRREWNGDAANLYYAKCTAMRDRFGATATNLDQIASAIRSAAYAYYEAEKRAIEIAMQRDAGNG